MGRILNKNRDPKINEFGPDDLVINTETGDIFAKANNRIFKILGRSQFDQSTTDALLKLLETSTDITDSGSFDGFNTIDGFYGVVVSNSTTGSSVSLHGGLPIDYGKPLPNSPYIKSNGGFDILMDNGNANNNSAFRVFKDTGLAGISPGVELFKVDEDGNLTVAGSISGSSAANTDIDGGSF